MFFFIYSNNSHFVRFFATNFFYIVFELLRDLLGYFLVFVVYSYWLVPFVLSEFFCFLTFWFWPLMGHFESFWALMGYLVFLLFTHIDWYLLLCKIFFCCHFLTFWFWPLMGHFELFWALMGYFWGWGGASKLFFVYRQTNLVF